MDPLRSAATATSLAYSASVPIPGSRSSEIGSNQPSVVGVYWVPFTPPARWIGPVWSRSIPRSRSVSHNAGSAQVATTDLPF